jgi:hypothetical protein
MINKLKTEVSRRGFVSTIIKNGQPNALPATGYTTGNLNFISVGLDPLLKGTSLVIAFINVYNRSTLFLQISKFIFFWI